jgi:hypothetical protein
MLIPDLSKQVRLFQGEKNFVSFWLNLYYFYLLFQTIQVTTTLQSKDEGEMACACSLLKGFGFSILEADHPH